MNGLLNHDAKAVKACNASLTADRLCIELSDGPEVSVPYKTIPWLKWLAKATPQQRNDWSLEPGGCAIYWEQLDDGVEICHLLGVEILN